MARYVVVGNSGAGKSTLAKRLARAGDLPHLDLDTLAWQPDLPPRRRPIEDSEPEILAFMTAHDSWVIEGCYADLLALALPRCSRLVLLDPGIEACVANARARPWEPHKYPTKAAQDANLDMLIQWIRDYWTRDDLFSWAAHRALFNSFAGDKLILTSREAIAAFPPDDPSA
jgi:adenylate kinase family enzyme